MTTKEANGQRINKAFSADVAVADGERAVTATITTAVCDRDGEVVIPAGVNSKEYEKNPVLLLQHSYWGMPLGKCVALRREDERIVAKFVFASRPENHPADEEWMPETVFSLFQQGVLRAFSIGFIPTETRPANDRDVEKFGGATRRVISKSKLLEVSVVTVPANQEAVATAVSKGLSEATAKALFGYEAKGEGEEEDDKPEMGTCSGCGKELPVDDMEEDGGEYTCPECEGEDEEGEKATDEEEDGELVVASVDVPEPKAFEPPAEEYVYHEIDTPAEDAEVMVRQLVTVEVAKRQGRAYLK